MIDIKTLRYQADSSFNNSERSNFEIQWEELCQYIIPSMSGLFNRIGNKSSTAGQRRNDQVHDSLAIQANADLAAALHSTLTNPATKWSKLRYKSDVLNNDSQAIAWLEQVVNTIHEKINESNFNMQASKNYPMLTALANGCLFQGVKRDSKGRFETFKFQAWHLSEVAWLENANGDVDTVFRKFELTAKQAVEKYKDRVSKKIQDAVEKTPNERFEFYHITYPNPDARKESEGDIDSAPPNKRPYIGVIFEAQACENDEPLELAGYWEFPIRVTRWEVTPGEVYGRGPGTRALPTIRSLNTLYDLALRSMAKTVSPPILVEQRNVLGTLDLRPNKATVVRKMDGIQEFVSGARIDVTQFGLDDMRNMIKSIFYVDKLMLPPRNETGEMTAYEVAQRMEQMQRVLGPTLSRLNYEFLNPLIVNCFKILLREGQLPEMPQIVKDEGIDIEVVYLNSLARSQVRDDIQNIQQWASQLAQFAQFKPEGLDNIDIDGIAELTARALNVPEKAIKNNREVSEIREQRQQQMQQAQALEAGTQGADIVSKLQGGGGTGGADNDEKI